MTTTPDITIIDDDGVYAVFANNVRARTIAEAILPDLEFTTGGLPAGVACADCGYCVQHLLDQLREMGLTFELYADG
jgi:hypothetical protein